MTTARQIPAHEEAEDCQRDCACPDCKPDLTPEERERQGTWERRACGCWLCKEALLKRTDR